MSITINGLTKEQVIIAEALWNAETPDAIVALMLVHGKEKVNVMKELITAAVIDQTEPDLSQVKDYLSKFRA